MPSQLHKDRAGAFRRRQEVHEDSRTQRARERADAERAEVQDGLDDLMEEIDAILEENEEALSSYTAVEGQ